MSAVRDDIAADIESALNDRYADEGEGHYANVRNLGGGFISTTYTDASGVMHSILIEAKALDE